MSELKPCPRMSEQEAKKVILSAQMAAYPNTDVPMILKPLYEYVETIEAEVDLLRSAQTDNYPRPLEEWGEDYGDCLWWEFPIEEPPYCGSPLASDWPGYHTHFTRFTCPDEAALKGE